MNKSKGTTTRYSTRLVLRIAVGIVFALATVVLVFSGNSVAQRDNDSAQRENGEAQRRTDFCSQTARALFESCKAEVTDGIFKKKAICINISDQKEREQCFDELDDAGEQGNLLCRQQRDERTNACQSLGEGRYDPHINPALFDDDFTNLTHPNPYFPLTIGNRWEYRGGNEVNIVEILNRTKLINGVRCIVAGDRVFKDGDLAEDTNDWFCQAKNGNVWYFGEEVKNLESFDGDNPRLPELVSIDGSFKFGREGDKGGLFFLISPRRGDIYLEEFSLTNAEDVTEILSTTYRFGSNTVLDQFVPQQLAKRFCSSGDCIVTKNFSLLEPGLFARKYYARGIGFFLEVKPDAGEVLQLTDCNFDPRCTNLPSP